LLNNDKKATAVPAESLLLVYAARLAGSPHPSAAQAET